MSHTTTGEWKSFEVRMRRRRAERLIRRAAAAADAGSREEARACLDEAHRLAPGADGAAAVEDKLRQHAPRVPAAPRAWPVVAAGIAGAAITAAVLAMWLRPHPVQVADDFRALRLEIPAAVASRDPMPIARGGDDPAAAAAPPAEKPGWIGAFESDTRDPGPVLAPLLLPAVPAAAVKAPEPSLPDAIAEIPVAGDIAAVAAAVDSLPAPTAPTPPPPPTPRADVAVRGVLDRYAAAYSALDADAAGQVWPRVNRGALGRAFDALASQRVSLGECRIEVAGASARATCAGSASWTPKIGDGEERTEARRWTFDLARAGTGWEIVDARVQNR